MLFGETLRDKSTEGPCMEHLGQCNGIQNGMSQRIHLGSTYIGLFKGAEFKVYIKPKKKD